VKVHFPLVCGTALVLVLATGCGSGNDDGAAGASGAASSGGRQGLADDGCIAGDDPLVAAAREEGSVVWSGTPAGDVRKVLPAAFADRYGVEVEYVGARNSETAAKIKAERDAGIFAHDVFTSGGESAAVVFYGSDWLGSLKDVLLPEIADGANWTGGETPWVDPEGQHILAISNFVQLPYVVNTDAVSADEVSEWDDLLRPEWRGKIVLEDPLESGGAIYTAAMLADEFGDDFVRKLYVDQQPTFLADARQEVDDVARGTFAVGVALHQGEVGAATSQGLPLEVVVPTKGQVTTAGSGMLSINNKAPHPNAAKLLVNWLACKEGGQLFNDAILQVSTRADVDRPDTVPAYAVPVEDQKYFDANDWDFLLNQKDWEDRISAILGN
jgi:iron(III) transport system substrate-binding protein